MNIYMLNTVKASDSTSCIDYRQTLKSTSNRRRQMNELFFERATQLEMLKHFVKYGMKIARLEGMKVKVLVVHAPLIKLIFVGHMQILLMIKALLG